MKMKLQKGQQKRINVVDAPLNILLVKAHMAHEDCYQTAKVIVTEMLNGEGQLTNNHCRVDGE